MKMPIGLPSPAFALKIGAAVIGTEADLILNSMWVLPGKLEKTGFKFTFPLLEDAINDILRTNP